MLLIFSADKASFLQVLKIAREVKHKIGLHQGTAFFVTRCIRFLKVTDAVPNQGRRRYTGLSSAVRTGGPRLRDSAITRFTIGGG